MIEKNRTIGLESLYMKRPTTVMIAMAMIIITTMGRNTLVESTMRARTRPEIAASLRADLLTAITSLNGSSVLEETMISLIPLNIRRDRMMNSRRIQPVSVPLEKTVCEMTIGQNARNSAATNPAFLVPTTSLPRRNMGMTANVPHTSENVASVSDAALTADMPSDVPIIAIPARIESMSTGLELTEPKG